MQEMTQSLRDYIVEQRKRGVHDSQIKLQLLRSGHNPASVDAALARRHQKKFPTSLMVLGLIVVIAALAILTLDYIDSPPQPILLDLFIQPLMVELQPGQDIVFSRLLSASGPSLFPDAELTHSILDSKSGEVLRSTTEMASIKVRNPVKSRFPIPGNLDPGFYLLQTLADYDGKRAVASFLFKVYIRGDNPSCFDNEQNQGEENIDCGGPCDACDRCSNDRWDDEEDGLDCGGPCIPCIRASCFDEIRNQNEQGIDCGGICRVCTLIDRNFRQLDPKEQLLEARELAKTDPDAALEHCRTSDGQAQRDECISQVADETDDMTICSSIIIPSKKDSCYLSFALEGDYTVCDKITNVYLMNSCFSLERGKN